MKADGIENSQTDGNYPYMLANFNNLQTGLPNGKLATINVLGKYTCTASERDFRDSTPIMMRYLISIRDC